MNQGVLQTTLFQGRFELSGKAGGPIDVACARCGLEPAWPSRSARGYGDEAATGELLTAPGQNLAPEFETSGRRDLRDELQYRGQLVGLSLRRPNYAVLQSERQFRRVHFTPQR